LTGTGNFLESSSPRTGSYLPGRHLLRFAWDLFLLPAQHFGCPATAGKKITRIRAKASVISMAEGKTGSPIDWTGLPARYFAAGLKKASPQMKRR